MKESEFIKNAQKGDKNAFCELYELYKNRLYRYAYYKLSSEADAEDAVMDCILCAWQGIKQLKKAEAFSAWIFKILRSSCAKYIDYQAKSRVNSSLAEMQNDASLSYCHSDLSLELSRLLINFNLMKRTLFCFALLQALRVRNVQKLSA